MERVQRELRGPLRFPAVRRCHVDPKKLRELWNAQAQSFSKALDLLPGHRVLHMRDLRVSLATEAAKRTRRKSMIAFSPPSAPAVTIGALPLATVLEGPWTLPNFPERIVLHGRSFRRAGWRQSYDGVVEQYREESVRNSMHLKVFTGGRWIVDHVDEDNPDLGRPLQHFFNDHPVGKFVKVAAPVCFVGATLLLVVRSLSR